MAAEERQAPAEGSLASQRDLAVLRSFARRIDASDAGAHNNLGVLYYNKGMYEEAVGAFMRALELDPRMQVAQRNLEIAYLHSGAADQRIAQLEEHLRSNPSDRDARWELGRTSALLGRHDVAIAAFTELLRYHPRDLGALIQLALSEKEIGDLELAARWLRQALDVDAESSLVHFFLGEIAYQQGAVERAHELLQRAVALNADNHEAWYLLGFVLGDLGRLEAAQAATERALKLNPALSRAQANLQLAPPEPGGYVEKSKRDSRMRVQVQSAHESPLTHYNLGVAFRKRGYFHEALAEYQLALHRGEDRDLVEQGIAEVHLLTRDAEAALALYESLVHKRPESPRLWNERGVALHQLGRPDDARESYRRAIACEPTYALALNNLGVVLCQDGQHDAALAAFCRAVESHERFMKARLNQALLHFRRRKLQLALDAYRQVLAIDAEQPVAWNGIGLVLVELRRHDEARAAFARALQARPRYAEAHYNMSFTLSTLGDFEGALRENKLALELDPYYVPQKFELAIDLEYEDADLAVEAALGRELRADEAVEDFELAPGALDTVFSALTPVRVPAQATPSRERDPYAMARDFLSKGFFDRAYAEARRALSRGGDPLHGATILGDIYARQGLWGEALERYQEARRLSADHLPALTGEATALLRLGRAMEARLAAESVLSRAPRDIDTLMLAAAARGEAGDPPAAMAALETARRVAPDRADVLRHIGDIARTLGDTDGAVAAYQHALELDPLYAIARFELARVLLARGDVDGAERELLQAIDAVPTYTEAILSLVALRRQRGRPKEALPLVVDLVERDLYHFDALIALGETLLDIGRRQDAMIAFDRVLRFDPDHAPALFHEGMLLAEQHRHRDAVTRWNRVVELAPSSEYGRRARQQLRSAADVERILGRAVRG